LAIQDEQINCGVTGNAVRILAAVIALSPFCLRAQPDIPISFETEFGSLGSELGQFAFIRGIAIGKNGEIVVADAFNERIQVCDVSGQCFAFGRPGTGPGEFDNPHGVAVDSGNSIVTVETNTNRIQIFSPVGEWQQMFGGRGSAFGQFRVPGGVWVDESDRILVADENNDRIQICSSEGQCTGFGGFGSAPGQFATPRAVAVDEAGRILVSERDNHRISICNEQGSCTVFGRFGDRAGEFNRPRELVPDGIGNIIIADGDNHRIQICDYAGSCGTFGKFGVGPGEFSSPVAVALDSQGRLYVGDQGNHRVQIFAYGAGFQINSGLNDAWYNPATPGQGFLVSVFPQIQQIFVAWFTYDTERPSEDAMAVLGEPGHRWITAQGAYTGGTASLTIYVTEGGVFDTADPPANNDGIGDGTMTVEFADCTKGLVTYEISSPDVSGEIPIQRITNDNVALCESLSDQ
jgi:DNA-binding beta-propeller fold protein YncE